MKIGIVGRGTVGNALALGLKRGHELVSYDKYKEGFQSAKEVAACPIIFFCVPTPMKEDGKIDLQSLKEAIQDIWLYSTKYNGQILVIKSTVVPGTTKIFASQYKEAHWAFCPEFLSERSSLEDFINTSRIIIGAEHLFILTALTKIFRDAKFQCSIHETDSKTAEFVKYYCNILGATKVTLANEMYSIAQKADISYKAIKKLVITNKFFTDQHLDVPGPDGKKGFGGKCFSKDLNAFICFAKELGYKPQFLEEIWKNNIKFRRIKDEN